MSPVSRWSILLLSFALSVGLVCQHDGAGAKEKKEEKKTDAKKQDKKAAKKEEKKTEAKKDEKKDEKKAESKEDKKVEIKEEKKEPFVPDKADVELAPKLQAKEKEGEAPKPDWVFAIDFSDDGKTIAAAGRDRLVRIWDVQSGTQLAKFDAGTSGPALVAWSPDGSLLAWSDTAGVVNLLGIPRG